MKRTHALLAVLAVIMVVALFWLMLWQPKSEAIAATEAEIVSTQDQQRLIEAEIVRLRAVRETAPEAEARLAAAAAIVPDGSALPSLLRQLQIAADESGLTLVSVNVGRPPEDLPAGELVASLPVNAAIVGSYFQVVDFLRRLEAPDITPRGVLWDSVTVTPDEYPTLTTALTGRTFAAAVTAPNEVESAAEDGTEGTAEDGSEAETTVEVEG